jgi:hypothetical protein
MALSMDEVLRNARNLMGVPLKEIPSYLLVRSKCK